MKDYSVNLRLRQLIREKRLKQKQVAAIAGMRDYALSRALHGKRPIYAGELLPLSQALGVEVEALLGAETATP